MKKLLLILLLVVPFLSGIAQNVIPPPNPPRLVNDYAGVLSKEQVAILEEKLVALDDSTSNQIAVVILKSLEGYEVQEYANKLFRSWGIGNKKTNNGVLILASIDDRKIWIEVGYGLEGAIPDVTASSIYRNEIVPEFKQQNYYRGIDNAINALSKAAVGEYKTKRVKKNNNSGDEGSSILTFIFIIIVIIFIVGAGGGGGRGGRGGGMMSRRGAANVAEALLWSSLLGGNNRGGGGFGGGGFGGGGFGGGGFGGFGGGSSGGGGAGGSW